MNEIDLWRAAVEWCLKNGVKAVDHSVTGYWHHQSGEGGEIMPPAGIHILLDEARTNVLAGEQNDST